MSCTYYELAIIAITYYIEVYLVILLSLLGHVFEFLLNKALLFPANYRMKCIIKESNSSIMGQFRIRHMKMQRCDPNPK